MRTVIVIGGGASGMTAAIFAARNRASVFLLEHMDRVGKKILSTGNGKCNYTNRRQEAGCYRGENPSFAAGILGQFGFEDTLDFFLGLGIYPREREGYFYPASGQASSVLDVLRMELDRLGVRTVTGCEIREMKKTKKGFCISTNQGIYRGDSCVIACGSKAFPKSGSDGSLFPYIEKFGHTWIDVVPALVQLTAKPSFFKSIAGIRSDISVKLYVDSTLAAKDRGEVQLTDYGISGIPVFQVSRFASRALAEKKSVHAVLDFTPDLSHEELKGELIRRFHRPGTKKSCEEALIGFFPKKLIPVFLKENQIKPGSLAESLSDARIHQLAEYIKHMSVEITGTKGFEGAQVCAGGVDTRELNQETLESRLAPGLFFAGEVIDIDGICGGYNLQWAWSSGYVAGSAAAQGGRSTKRL
ncbi:MAG: NAD(P)/FAD-dependent oxidoreductase [Roseburia sp.]|nr:NAD(P)/FAD-dependent oxidoreductase [Roseburia sp.]